MWTILNRRIENTQLKVSLCMLLVNTMVSYYIYRPSRFVFSRMVALYSTITVSLTLFSVNSFKAWHIYIKTLSLVLCDKRGCLLEQCVINSAKSLSNCLIRCDVRSMFKLLVMLCNVIIVLIILVYFQDHGLS